MDNQAHSIEILTWAMTGGFTIVFGSMIFMFKSLNDEMRETRTEIREMRKDIQDVDRRLCRIEGSMAAKECCMLKDSNEKRKSE